MADPAEAAALALVDRCRERGLTLATGESITAGLVASTIARIPGCSAVLLGGVVAYAPQAKAALLGVEPGLLDHLVSAEVAAAMAEGAARALGADLGIGTTGAAGPDPLDGQPPGTAFVAASLGGRTIWRRLGAGGPRNAVRAQTALEALRLAGQLVGGE